MDSCLHCLILLFSPKLTNNVHVYTSPCHQHLHKSQSLPPSHKTPLCTHFSQYGVQNSSPASCLLGTSQQWSVSTAASPLVPPATIPEPLACGEVLSGCHLSPFALPVLLVLGPLSCSSVSYFRILSFSPYSFNCFPFFLTLFCFISVIFKNVLCL